jgi:hypothetical protein
MNLEINQDITEQLTFDNVITEFTKKKNLKKNEYCKNVSVISYIL